MADGKTHNRMGKAVGVTTAVLQIRADDTPLDALMRVIGGYLGGYFGSKIPDWLEPAVHSYHRDVAHSVAAGTTVFEIMRRMGGEWEALCQQRATDAEACGAQGDVWFWKIATGFGPAVATGYLSHLALDAQTPRGIPLLKSGF